MQIENCPFCLLRGVESEVIEDKNNIEYQYLNSLHCKNYCGYATALYRSIEDATKYHNLISRAVRESMWTRFDPKDESTYPPNEETQIELTLNDGSLYLDEWVYFDTEDGIGWGFETDICYHRIKAWRIPTPYKGQ